MLKFLGYLLLAYVISGLVVVGLCKLDMAYGTTTTETVVTSKEQSTLYIQTRSGEVMIRVPLKVKYQTYTIEVRRSWSGLSTQSKVVE